MSILPLLQTLASLEATPRERNMAARQLLPALSQRGLWLAGKDASRKLSEADLEDVVQHVLLQASVGTARCHAQFEGEAWGWCRMVARNKALDILERQRRESPSEDPHAGKEPQSVHDDEERVVEETDQILKQIVEVTQHAPRGDDKAVSVSCAIEYLIGGASIEEQIDRWGFPDGRPAGATKSEIKRARDRVYSYRHRGAGYVEQTLDFLEKTRALSETDTALLRALVRARPKKTRSVRPLPPRPST